MNGVDESLIFSEELSRAKVYSTEALARDDILSDIAELRRSAWKIEECKERCRLYLRGVSNLPLIYPFKSSVFGRLTRVKIIEPQVVFKEKEVSCSCKACLYVKSSDSKWSSNRKAISRKTSALLAARSFVGGDSTHETGGWVSFMVKTDEWFEDFIDEFGRTRIYIMSEESRERSKLSLSRPTKKVRRFVVQDDCEL
jgi:hypothetical protein